MRIFLDYNARIYARAIRSSMKPLGSLPDLGGHPKHTRCCLETQHLLIRLVLPKKSVTVHINADL
jgi:hypothetical protein